MENDQQVALRLRALATAPERRSKAGRVRALLPEIENALTAGVGLGLILETLNAEGLDMTLDYFKTTLHRVRQGRTTPVPSAAPLANSTPKREMASEPNGSEPEEIDATSENSEVLTAKQRREKIADRFITPQSSNPLLNKFAKKETKQ